MRAVYLVTQWFPPEHAPIGHMLLELGEMLAEKGWQVTVITGFPNHPGGVVFDGYKKRLFQEERMGSLRIWRVFLHTSARRSVFSRILTFVSFTLSSSLVLLFRGKPDVVFAVLQPLSQGAILPLIARLKKARLAFNIQDLHPDAQIRLGLVKNRLLIMLLKSLERYSYRRADALSVISEDFRSHCLRNGAESRRVAVIKNWVDLEEIRPAARKNPFRDELGLSETDIVILFAGTIGLASGAEIVADVAEQLADEDRIKFVFVGEGESLPDLKAQARERALGNILFSPFQPREKLASVQAISDISLLTIRPDSDQLSVPSKVLGYMAAARPVLASVAADSETARFIQDAGSGVIVPPSDARAIADAIRDLLARPGEARTMGENGRRYLEQNLSTKAVGERYHEFFLNLVESGHA